MFYEKKTKEKQNIKSKGEEQQRKRKGCRKIEEVHLKDRKKRIIKDERNEEKILIEINGGQGNKKQKKLNIKSATV